RVRGVVQLAEGELPVAVQVEGGDVDDRRDLAAIDPDVPVQIRVSVIDAGVDHGDVDRLRADEARRPRGCGLRAILTGRGSGRAAHPVERAAGVVRIGGR